MEIPLTSEQQTLAASESQTARSIARYVARRWPSLATELESDACLALVHAARSYRDDRGCTFRTYVNTIIRLRLRDTLREHQQRETPLPAIQSALTSADTSIDDHDAFERRICGLPDRHRFILRLMFVEGMGFAEAGKVLGLTCQRVCILYRNAVRALGGTHLAFPRHALGSMPIRDQT